MKKQSEQSGRKLALRTTTDACHLIRLGVAKQPEPAAIQSRLLAAYEMKG